MYPERLTQASTLLRQPDSTTSNFVSYSSQNDTRNRFSQSGCVSQLKTCMRMTMPSQTWRMCTHYSIATKPQRFVRNGLALPDRWLSMARMSAEYVWSGRRAERTAPCRDPMRHTRWPPAGRRLARRRTLVEPFVQQKRYRMQMLFHCRSKTWRSRLHMSAMEIGALWKCASAHTYRLNAAVKRAHAAHNEFDSLLGVQLLQQTCMQNV